MLTPEQKEVLELLKDKLSIEFDTDREYGTDKNRVYIYLKLDGETISEDYVTIYNQ